MSKKGLKSIFALRSRFSNFQSIPVNLSCKLFDVLIRPILLYNCEVWFMEEYLPIVRAKERASKNGNNCDSINIADRSSFEKIHSRYCKSILGLKKTACNISSKTELGRIQIESFIKIQVILYFCRLNCENINPLLKEAYNLNKILNEGGLYTWYTHALKIFEEFDIDINEYETFDKPFQKIKYNLKGKVKKIVEQKYINQIMSKLLNLTNESKLYLYKQIKDDFGLEKYLTEESSFKNRQFITKFRVSDHPLEIEIGRYKNVLRENRLCTVCKDIEDEYHFFLYCNKNKHLRQNMFQHLQLDINFDNNNRLGYIKQILNPKKELLPYVCDFIKQSLELRK